MRVGIVRGLSGNFSSVESAFLRLGVDVEFIDIPGQIPLYSHLVLPGVGAFGSSMLHLNKTGLTDGIKAHVAGGRPLLGICLGAQLLFERGSEGGEQRGLEMIQGTVQPLSTLVRERRLPHTGWNWVRHRPSVSRGHPDPDGYYYFNHEYYFQPTHESDVVAWTQYGAPFPVSVRHGNVTGYQFHPEKSQELGLSALRAFIQGQRS